MKNPMTSLMKKDWKIVECAKWFYIFSLIVILVGVILAATIKPKIGIDFQSGIVINVEYTNGYPQGDKVQAGEDVTAALEAMTDSDGLSYNIKVDKVSYEGSNSLRVVYRSDRLFALGSDEFSEAEKDIQAKLRSAINEDYDNNPTVNIKAGGITNPVISSELLLTAIAAIILACTVMLIYVMFRFELASGLAAIIALLHDIAFMFAFMVFCRVEITSTFIAALVAILGYSINNTLVVFDRVRENMKTPIGTSAKKKDIKTEVNLSLKETFGRSVNTTVTTLFAMVMLAALGVESIRIFAFPIIIGIVSGTYSSFCLAPSLYVNFKQISAKRAQKKAKARLQSKSKAKAKN